MEEEKVTKTQFDMDRLVWTEKERESWFESLRLEPISVGGVYLPPMEPLMLVNVESGQAVEIAEEILFSGLLKVGIIRFNLGHYALVQVSAKLEGEYIVEGLVGENQHVRLVLHRPINIGDTIELTIKNMDTAFDHILGIRFYAEENGIE